MTRARGQYRLAHGARAAQHPRRSRAHSRRPAGGRSRDEPTSSASVWSTSCRAASTLLIRLEPASLTLHTHLRMDGRWRIHPAGYRVHDPDDHVRVVLANTAGTAVGWRVHDVALVPTSAEDTLVGHLGPDLLGPDWDAAEASRRLSLDPSRAIGEALLDQRNLAGVGNVFKAEICFLRGISPWTPVGEVNDLAGLVDLAHRLLRCQSRAVRPRHDRRSARGQTHLGLRPCRPTVSSLRRYDSGRLTRRRLARRSVTKRGSATGARAVNRVRFRPRSDYGWRLGSDCARKQRCFARSAFCC